MITVGQVLSLHVDRPAAGGRMIARFNGQIVFVTGAVPGERVTARVTRVAKGVAFAECVSVEEASPDRRPPFADPACGGCAFAHIEYQRQLSIKAEIITDGLARIGRVAPPLPVTVAASLPEGYRMRARLHAEAGQIGFFREGSHRLCDARSTKQLLPQTCEVLDRLSERLKGSRVASVHELEIAENIDASARAVHLMSPVPLDSSMLSDLGAVAGLTGVTLTAPAGAGKAPETHLLAGDPYVTDRLSIDGTPIVLRRHVRAFFQGNRHLLQALVSHVASLVPAGMRLLDLYAGVGLFAVTAAAVRQAAVVAVEGDPYAARDLEINGGSAGHVDARHQPVEDYLARRPQPADVVILDPPRTGLSPEVVTGLIAMAVPRAIYVSCDVATLARDLRRFAESGYRIIRVDGFDLFPNTAHVETVVELVRG